MTPEEIRARGRELYTLELEYTTGRSDGERIDLPAVERAAAIRWQQEILRPDEQAEVHILALRNLARSVNQAHTPRFDDGGNITLRLTDIIRVADNEAVGVIYATEDDWSAYLAIKRRNALAQQRDFENTEQGVTRIRGDIRAYAARVGVAQPHTLDACPHLFDRAEAEAA